MAVKKKTIEPDREPLIEGNVEYLFYHTNANYLFIVDEKTTSDIWVRILVATVGIICYLATMGLAWLIFTPGLVHGAAVVPGGGRSPFQQVVGGQTSFGFTSQLTRNGRGYQRVSDSYAQSSDSLEEDRPEEINWPDDDDQQQLEFPKGKLNQYFLTSDKIFFIAIITRHKLNLLKFFFVEL